MGDSTEIAWTDSTFNPWWGCAKISPGCANCYAEALDKRMGGDFWGPGKTPRTTSISNWNKPLRWNRDAEASGIRRKVFCGSMCDWAALEGTQENRDRLWQLIRSTPMLDWQLLTKRANRIEELLPGDWGQGYYNNVWLGVSVENQTHGVPRIDALRRIPARVKFLSCEPLIADLGELNLSGIDWVIVGGESGPNARPMEPEWVDSIHKQCQAQGVAFFFKQLGGTAKDKGGCLFHGEVVKEWPIATKLALFHVGDIEDEQYRIEREYHEGKRWESRDARGVTSMYSYRLSPEADIDGDDCEFLEIAKAIDRRGSAQFKRCAVAFHDGMFQLWSPKNSDIHAEISIAEADYLKRRIEERLSYMHNIMGAL